MENLNKIIEIDISKQARALAWLRFSDYALVIICGSWAIGLIPSLFANITHTNIGEAVFHTISISIYASQHAQAGDM